MDKFIIWMSAASAATITYIGDWSAHIWTLGILMCIDFIIGLSVPIFLGKSKKSPTGEVSSYTMRRGIIKKAVMFLMIYVCHLLGAAAHVQFVADAVCIMFICTEVKSIIEHAHVMGIPTPKILINTVKSISEKSSAAVDVLASGGKPLQSENVKDTEKENEK